MPRSQMVWHDDVREGKERKKKSLSEKQFKTKHEAKVPNYRLQRVLTFD